MITYSNANNDAVWELRGLSTDTKPTDKIPNGSSFREMDTGCVYMFDAESKTWFKQPSGSSSDSSGEGSTDTETEGDASGDDVATDEEVQDAVDDIFG